MGHSLEGLTVAWGYKERQCGDGKGLLLQDMVTGEVGRCWG